MNWTNKQMSEMVVRWQDGTYDTHRVCDECHGPDCEYPVLGKLTPTGDGYHEIVTSRTYWEWCEQNADRDGNGNIVEPKLANVESKGRDPNALS